MPLPYIDPPKDGYDYIWGDDVPWYWFEKSPPVSDPRAWDPGYLLSSNVVDSTLKFEDFPGGSVGVEVDFVTFLISDFGNKVYDILGGFSWKMKVGADGFTDITSLDKGAKFTSEYAKEIKDEFGCTMIPEPSTMLLLGSGLAGLIGLGRKRLFKKA